MKDKLITPLYKNSKDDSYYMMIKFEDIDKVVSEQEVEVDKFTVDFYRYMQDNYRQISDYYVQRMDIGVEQPFVLIETALADFKIDFRRKSPS